MKIQVYPMDYQEFCDATGGNYELLCQIYNTGKAIGQPTNRKLMRDLRIYMAVGGMPQAVEAYGKIDVLVNLAGGNQAGATIPPDKTIFDLDIDAFRTVVDLNLFGTVLPTMVFAEVMVGQGKGSIINISSESSLRPLTRVVGYGCAKAAINNFTQYMAGELAIKFGEGLRVNAMAPGFFLTEQNRALMSNPDGSPSDRCNTIVAHTPFRRLGKPEELLGTLQWLASDASAFVTGTVIPIDGGFDAFSI